MMDETLFAFIRFAHILGATVLLGTGAGIAFFMVVARHSNNPVLIAHVASTVVIADMLFTASAVVIQPVTGFLLAIELGWPITSGWIALSLALYVMVGVFWLPVVAIQLRLRNLAKQAAAEGVDLPDQWYRLYRIWFACGFPAFFGVLTIIWLMITRPDISFAIPLLGYLG